MEIKAPRVPVGLKEIEQIRRYERTVSSSNEFDKTTTRWDFFVVSGEIGDDAEHDRKQKTTPYGVLFEGERVTTWALSWSEVIDQARREMHLVQAHLERKSEELTASDYLRTSFPNILKQINARKTERPKKQKPAKPEGGRSKTTPKA